MPLNLSYEECTLEVGAQVWQSLLHCRIPVVLDGVIGAARQKFGHVRPFASMDHMCEVEDPLLFEGPFGFEDDGVEVVVPSFPTLLAETSGHKLGDERPPLWAILVDE